MILRRMQIRLASSGHRHAGALQSLRLSFFFPSERFRQITDADIGAGGQTTGSTFKEIGRDIPLLCVCFTSSLVAKQKMPTFAE